MADKETTDNRGISASKVVDPKAGPAQAKPAENPQIVAQAGTVPTVAAAPGASPPHPTSMKVDVTGYTEEQADALGRAVLAENGAPVATDEVLTRAFGEPIGDPIECVAKRKFTDERGATIRQGELVYITDREGVPFPIANAEPVDKAVAEKFLEEDRNWRRDRQEAKAERDSVRTNLRSFLEV